MKKRFDRSLYNQYDQLAKNAGTRFLLETVGAVEVRPHQDRYGPDLCYTMPDGSEGTLECEVKLTWKGGEFPYPEINVLGRKTKFFINNTHFFMLSGNGIDYLHVDAHSIMQCPLVEVPNKYVYQGESFYKVPTDKVKFGAVMGIDNKAPLCHGCGKWVGYRKVDSHLMCIGCGYEQT